MGARLGQCAFLLRPLPVRQGARPRLVARAHLAGCLLYTSDAADERSSVDLGGRRIIKKQTKLSTGHDALLYTKGTSVHTETRHMQYNKEIATV